MHKIRIFIAQWLFTLIRSNTVRNKDRILSLYDDSENNTILTV